jgi:hypothetical protein
MILVVCLVVWDGLILILQIWREVKDYWGAHRRLKHVSFALGEPGMNLLPQ